MTTIQIADKPTLDAIKAMLASSGGGVVGYPNATIKVLSGAVKTVSVTGKGRATNLTTTYPCIVGNIDGVETNAQFPPGAVVNFEKNITLRHDSASQYVLIQLAN